MLINTEIALAYICIRDL